MKAADMAGQARAQKIAQKGDAKMAKAKAAGRTGNKIAKKTQAKQTMNNVRTSQKLDRISARGSGASKAQMKELRGTQKAQRGAMKKDLGLKSRRRAPKK